MKKSALFMFLLLVSSILSAQTEKRPLTFDEILKWNRITETHLSNDGKYIVYKEEPWKGDPVLKVTTPDARELASFLGGTKATVTSDSKSVVFTLEPPVDTVRNLKLSGTKKDDLPKNKLVIYNFGENQADTICNLASSKVPEKWAGWAFYQVSSQGEKAKGEEKDKKKGEKNDPLCVQNLLTGLVDTFPAVSDYTFAEESKVLAFVSKGDSTFEAGVYVYDLNQNAPSNILASDGKFVQLSINKTGDQLAFLADTTESKEAAYSVYYWPGKDQAEIVMDNESKALPENWEISENGRLSFSENNERLFIGTAPKKAPKDTTILEEEIPVLDIWTWDEEVLHTQQLYNKSRDEKKSYIAVIHLDNKKAVQLETELFTDVELINKGDADQMLAVSNRPYAIQTMWEGSPEHNDFYLVDVNSGDYKMIKQD